jgi:hypothetical protein
VDHSKALSDFVVVGRLWTISFFALTPWFERDFEVDALQVNKEGKKKKNSKTDTHSLSRNGFGFLMMLVHCCSSQHSWLWFYFGQK